MRQIIDSLIVGAVVAFLALPAGAPAGGSETQPGKPGKPGKPERTVTIDVGIRVDADWIAVKGSWSVVPAEVGTDTDGTRFELRIGVVPNMIGRAEKVATLVRALRTTAVCAAKQWFAGRYNIHSP
jgi:hypothetical protein